VATTRVRPRGPRTTLAAAALAGTILALAALLPTAAPATESDAWESLARGGHVALIRHALAPGTGDPRAFDVDDCSTQRNLSAQGREQARRIGDAFRAAGIARAMVFSSQWCRCLETARLLDLGPVEPLPALNSFYQRPDERAGRLAALRAFLADLEPDGAPVVLVTHQVTITAMTDGYPASGEIFVAALDAAALRADRPLGVAGRIRIEP